LTVASFTRRRYRVLVIDDDASMRGLLDVHLRNAGYEVLLAEDAIVGGHLVVEAVPDLLIVDVHMPYMTGYQFVEALKADPTTRNIAIVFLTSDDDVEERSGQLGANAYLKKPVTANKLLEIVRRFTP